LTTAPFIVTIAPRGTQGGTVEAPEVFLAGVIQGSERGHRIVSQDYRSQIRRMIEARVPSVTVYDPIQHHPGALDYTLAEARDTFFGHIDLVRRSRAVIAYLPEASLGTAIELWEAYQRGIPAVVISPLRENWVIRLLSAVVCEDIAAFGRWLAEGGFERLLASAEAGAGAGAPRG
jgi:hypothetical protein